MRLLTACFQFKDVFRPKRTELFKNKNLIFSSRKSSKVFHIQIAENWSPNSSLEPSYICMPTNFDLNSWTLIWMSPIRKVRTSPQTFWTGRGTVFQLGVLVERRTLLIQKFGFRNSEIPQKAKRPLNTLLETCLKHLQVARVAKMIAWNNGIATHWKPSTPTAWKRLVFLFFETLWQAAAFGGVTQFCS